MKRPRYRQTHKGYITKGTGVDTRTRKRNEINGHLHYAMHEIFNAPLELFQKRVNLGYSAYSFIKNQTRQ